MYISYKYLNSFEPTYILETPFSTVKKNKQQRMASKSNSHFFSSDYQKTRQKIILPTILLMGETLMIGSK